MNETIRISINIDDHAVRDLNSVISDLNDTIRNLQSSVSLFHSSFQTLSIELSASSNAWSVAESGASLLLGTLGLLALSNDELKRVSERITSIGTTISNFISPIKGATGLINGIKAALTTLAGPVGIAVAAMGGLIAVNMAVGRGNRALIESFNDLRQSLYDSRAAHEARRGVIQDEARENQRLINRLRELQSQESMTNAERMESYEIAGMLNERISGLNLNVTRSTGLLDDNGVTSLALAGHYAELSYHTSNLESNQERLNQITEDYTDIDLRLDELREQLENTSETMQDATYFVERQNGAYVRLNDQISYLEDQQYNLRYETKQLENQTVETGERMVELWDSVAWHHSLAFETMSESQQAVVTGFQGMYEIGKSRLGDLTREFQENADLTWEAVQENQDRIIEATAEHTELYAELVAAGVSEAYLQAIGADSVEALPLLRGMLDDGIDAVKERESEWFAAHEANADTFIDAFEFSNEHAAVIRGYMLGGIRDTFLETVEAANFPDIGDKIIDDFTGAISDGDSVVSEAVVTIGKAASRALEKTIERANFRTIGQDTMAGFNQGLQSQEAMVMATARRIAENVASTMKNALDINSPSRVMREEIGRFIPEGVAAGIDKYAGRAVDGVERLADDLVNIKLNIPSIESIIGMQPSLGLASANSGAMTTYQTHTHNHYDRLFEGANIHWHNKEDIRKTMEEIALVRPLKPIFCPMYLKFYNV